MAPAPLPLSATLFAILSLGLGNAAAQSLEVAPGVAAQVNTATGISAGNALLNTCVTGRNQGTQFQADCNAIFGESNQSAQANAINQVAADQLAAQNSAATNQFRTNLGAIGGRLASIRLASGSAAFSEGLSLAQADALGWDTGGGASADASFGRFGGFFNLRTRWGDEDANGFQPGYDFDGWGGVAGLDYRFSNQLVGGIALTYFDDDVDYANGRGDMSTETWGLMGYGTLFLDNGLFLDGMIGYGWGDYDLKRNLVYGASSQNVNQVAQSTPEGNMFSLSLGGGYNIPMGGSTLTPLARLDYLRNDIDGFSEEISNPGADGGAMAVSMDDATYKSLTSKIGVQLSHAFSHGGGVIVPTLRLTWVHEFENDQQLVAGRFIADVQPNGTPFFVVTSNPDRDYVDLGLSISGQFANGRSAFLAYNTLLGYSDLTYNAVNAGVRLEF